MRGKALKWVSVKEANKEPSIHSWWLLKKRWRCDLTQAESMAIAYSCKQKSDEPIQDFDDRVMYTHMILNKNQSEMAMASPMAHLYK